MQPKGKSGSDSHAPVSMALITVACFCDSDSCGPVSVALIIVVRFLWL